MADTKAPDAKAPDANAILEALHRLLTAQTQQNQDDDQSQSRKPVSWNLLKVLCPKKLDITEATVSSHKLWEQGLQAFIVETGLDTYDWCTQAMGLQSTMEEETYLKVDALRHHMEVGEQESITKVLKVVQDLVEGSVNKWIHRQKFHRLSQGDDTARQFYTTAVSLARDCEFDAGYCNTCMKKAVDDRLVDKLVFACKSETARRTLLKKKDLSLDTAREILESQEQLRETESSLHDSGEGRVGAIGGKQRHRSRSRGRKQQQKDDKSTPCTKCGLMKHRGPECPAKGSTCRYCGGQNHWAQACYKAKKNGGQGQKFKPPKHRHIISSINTCTEKVRVRCEGRDHQAVIDTGSDWTCTSPDMLEQNFKEVPQNLLPPTEAMSNTKNASGQLMNALGYFSTTLEFGAKKVDEDLVVFADLDDTYLSKKALVGLGIVVINITPKVDKIKAKKKKTKKPSTEAHQSQEPQKPPKFETVDSEDPPLPAKPIKSTIRVPPIPPRRDKPFPINGQMKPLGDITKEDLQQEFSDVFAPRNEPMMGEEFRIALKPDAQPTKIYKARPVPYHWEEKLKAEMNRMVTEDTIEKITHPTEWCHALVCARKKNGDLRVCIDFRPLNRHALREPYPQPPIVDVVQHIKADQAGFFASADATAGYNQCRLAEESRDLTTFITPFGRFRYKRAPFGVISISDHFNRRMDELLEGLPSLVRVVDDTLVYGRTAEDLAVNTIKFLQRCREKGIRLNQQKFLYKETKITFAGCEIGRDGFTIDPKVNQAIRQFPEPKTLTQVKGFHGLASQLAPYDGQLAHKLHPLRHLLKSKTPVVDLNEEERRAFEDIKIRLSSPEVLTYFCPGRPLELYTDAACTKGFGFLLRQLQPDNSWRPLMLGSRTLLDAETRYAPIEAEVTAMAWALRKARKFLLGAPRFKVFTDHRPLVSLVNAKRYDEIANNRILRNVLKCRDYNMQVEYIKGTSNVAADALSRAPASTPDEEDIAESEKINHQIRAVRTAALQDTDMTAQEEEILEAGETDPEYRKLRDQILQGFPDVKRDLDEALHPYWSIRTDLMVADDDLILFGTRLVIPKSLRKQVLTQLHAGHRGMVGTKARASMSIYWPNINNQIEQVIKTCQLCQVDRPTQPKEPEIHFPVPPRCFEYLSADLADHEGKKFLITTDWKSGWFTVRQLRSSNAASVIHELRLQFMDTSVPSVFFSDNGPPFSSREFTDFCRRWGIHHVTSSPYYPQANTFAENGVKNAKSLLRKCYKKGKMDWEEWTQGLLAIRNTPHASSGLSPAVILYGRQVKEIVPAHKSALSKDWHRELASFDHTIAKARQQSEKYKKGRDLVPLKVGDPVFVQNRTTKRWDKFAVIQEKNERIRKYTLRLPSGLITVRNRRDIKRRFPPENVPNAGTRDWDPFPEDDPDDESDTAQTPPTSRPQTPTTPPRRPQTPSTPKPQTPPTPKSPSTPRPQTPTTPKPPTPPAPKPPTPPTPKPPTPPKPKLKTSKPKDTGTGTVSTTGRPKRSKQLPVWTKDYHMERP